jgi:site-specific recombinase XerC
MSHKNQLLAELKGASRKVGGAHLTLQARDYHLKLFCVYCALCGFGLFSISQIKTKHIRGFADYLRASGRSPRTIHNILSSIRAALRGAGKNLQNMHIDKNSDLGLAGGDRRGKKEPFPDRLLYPLLILLVGSDPEMFAALAIERFIGLRGMEVIRCRESLKTWLRQLNENQSLSITFGSKGGKPRRVMIHPGNVSWMRLALSAALDLTNSGRSPLIHAPTLKKAVRRYRYKCQKIGLTGKYAPHSLRYRYTVEMLEFFRGQGYSDREAFAMASMNLGHGDRRGRWVKSTYARPIVETDRAATDETSQEPDDIQ